MTRNVFLFGIFLISLITLSTYGQKMDAWKEYSSLDGKFSIMFPGSPKTGLLPTGEDSIDSVTYITNLQDGKFSWSVAYFDEPKPLTNSEAIKKLFDRTQKFLTRSEYQHVIKEDNEAYSGYPARNLKVRLDYDKNRIELIRLVLVEQRVYEISMVTAIDKTDTEEMKRFFDSFKVQPLTDDERKAI